MRSLVALLGMIACVSAALCAHAEAAVPYDVHACRLPGGQPAPSRGWSPRAEYVGIAVSDSCQTGPGGPYRALTARFGQSTWDGASGGWTFTAPPDTVIANVGLRRAVRSATFPNVEYWEFRRDGDPYALEYCTSYELGCYGLGSLDSDLDPANAVGFNGFADRALSAMLACGSIGGPGGECSPSPPAEFKIYAARVGLVDQVTPEIASDLSGSLARSGALIEGDGSLTFSATDKGGRIARVGVLADGHEAVDRAVVPGDARCEPPYVDPVPCPLSATVTLDFDTSRLANGVHIIQAFARDVSGNRATSAPVAISTRNGSVPNGAGATRLARLEAYFAGRDHRTVRIVRYGHRATVRGRLTAPDGTPIDGARIDVTARVLRPGSLPRARGSALTDAQGRFSYTVPPGASRNLDFGYRAFSLDEGVAATASLTARVPARARLRLNPHRIRNGRRVVFTGRLAGGPGQREASIILYALVSAARGRTRIPVSSLRADARGRFRFGYRFRTVQRATRFRFQAQIERRAAYPYAAGVSNVVSVVVRP